MRKLELNLNDESALANAISQLSREDAQHLNKLIVEHLKSMRENSYAEHMARFSVGDRVRFIDKEGLPQQALVLRLNRKTASLLTDDGERWNVAPQLLELEQAAVDPEMDLFPGGRPYTDSNGADSNDAVGQDQDEASAAGSSKTRASVTSLPVKQQGVEWVGGILPLPGQITGEGPVYQPVAVVWMNEEGFVMNSEVTHPDSVFDELPKSLQETLDRVVRGAELPRRIRLADAQAVDVLRSGFPDIEFEHADTPELTELKESMLGHFSTMGDDVTYLSSGASADAVGAMFTAAAGLYKARPWQTVPHDQCLIGVSIPSLNVQNAIISVIGQQRQNFGFLYFPELRDHEQYIVAIDGMSGDVEVEVPLYTGLTFEPGAGIDDAQRKEIAEHHWQVANSKAYPDVFTPGKGGTRRPITPADIALLEILCLAIPDMMARLDTPHEAWLVDSDEQRLNVTVNASGGETEVIFDVPYPYETLAVELNLFSPLIGRLLAIGRASDDVDWDVVKPLNDALISGYNGSKERQALGKIAVNISELLLEFAVNFMNATIATLQPSELEEILYDIVPRKVAVSAKDAGDIIMDVRAFYQYLKREHGFWKAQACLDVLNSDAEQQLADALGNSNNYGMGKALLAQAEAAGFDINSPSGLKRFMAAVNSGELSPNMGALPPGMPMGGFMPPAPPSPVVKPVDRKARKNKRKAARKARKKSR